MNRTKRVLSLFALVLSLTFVFAVSGISVAAETDTDTVTATETVAEDSTESSAVESSTEAASGTETAGDDTTADTEAVSTPATVESTGLTKKAIINLIIGGVLLVILIVLCVVFRRKIPGWFRSVKSECKKIVWCPKEQLKHSSIVVLVTIISLVIAIFALDSIIPKLIGWADDGIDALMALITKK